MFRKLDRLIPLFQKYECRDFTKIFMDNYNFYCKNNTPKIKFNLNKKNIPVNDRWECRDFKLNNKSKLNSEEK